MKILPRKERRGSVLPVSLAVLTLALEPFLPPAVMADPPASSPAGVSSKSVSTSTLYGVIRSTKDGKPLSDVPVTITSKKAGISLQERSSMQGGFIFTSLPAGDYIVTAGGEKYSLQRKEGLLKEGTVGEIDFNVTPLSVGLADIIGMVFKQQGDAREPMSVGIKIKNEKTGEVYTVHSNSKGQYSLNEIPAGRYDMQVMKRGFTPVNLTLDVNGKMRQDIVMNINRMAEAEISAEGDKKIRENNGAISIVDRKRFVDNLSTGAFYTLMQNTPGIEYFNRSGSQGISGDTNYLVCRGYTAGGQNNQAFGTSGIEVSVEGIPMNIEADGGELYDLGIMNTDIKSGTVKRGVTTSRETGSFAAGCSIDFELVEPTQDAYQTINAGGGSYGLYYTSYVNNSGINPENNVGGYQDFTVIRQDGYQAYTNLQEYQYYGNLTKYLNNGKVYFITTANWKEYDRGHSVSLATYNADGPTASTGASYQNPQVPDGTQNSPFYKNWNYARVMFDLGYKDQVTPDVRITNSLYVNWEPYGDTSIPAGFGSCTNGTCTGNQFTSGSSFQSNLNPNYNNILGYEFLQNYYQAEGYKAGDIAEVKYKLFRHDVLYLGMKGQYAQYYYGVDPLLSPNIVGGTASAQYSETNIVGYLEDKYKPVKQVEAIAGFRVASIAQYFNDLIPLSEQANFKGSQVGPSNGAAFLIPMPHVGINIYPNDNWKLYVTGGETFGAPAIFDYKGLGSTGLSGNINPEIVWDLSVGARYENKRSYAALDVYSDYIGNMPVQVPFTVNGTTFTQYENISEARQMGVELQARYIIGWGVSLSGNYSYNYGVLGNTPIAGVYNFQGDMNPFVPLNMGMLGVNYDHGPYHLVIDERYTGLMNVIDFSGGLTGTGNPQVMVPGYFTTDLYATYDLPRWYTWYKKADIYVDAFNLFNTNYYNPAGLEPSSASGTNLETLFVYPGEPVNVFAGLKLTF